MPDIQYTRLPNSAPFARIKAKKMSSLTPSFRMKEPKKISWY